MIIRCRERPICNSKSQRSNLERTKFIVSELDLHSFLKINEFYFQRMYYFKKKLALHFKHIPKSFFKKIVISTVFVLIRIPTFILFVSVEKFPTNRLQTINTRLTSASPRSLKPHPMKTAKILRLYPLEIGERPKF